MVLGEKKGVSVGVIDGVEESIKVEGDTEGGGWIDGASFFSPPTDALEEAALTLD